MAYIDPYFKKKKKRGVSETRPSILDGQEQAARDMAGGALKAPRAISTSGPVNPSMGPKVSKKPPMQPVGPYVPGQTMGQGMQRQKFAQIDPRIHNPPSPPPTPPPQGSGSDTSEDPPTSGGATVPEEERERREREEREERERRRQADHRLGQEAQYGREDPPLAEIDTSTRDPSGDQDDPANPKPPLPISVGRARAEREKSKVWDFGEGGKSDIDSSKLGDPEGPSQADREFWREAALGRLRGGGGFGVSTGAQISREAAMATEAAAREETRAKVDEDKLLGQRLNVMSMAMTQSLSQEDTDRALEILRTDGVEAAAEFIVSASAPEPPGEDPVPEPGPAPDAEPVPGAPPTPDAPSGRRTILEDLGDPGSWDWGGIASGVLELSFLGLGVPMDLVSDLAAGVSRGEIKTEEDFIAAAENSIRDGFIARALWELVDYVAQGGRDAGSWVKSRFEPRS